MSFECPEPPARWQWLEQVVARQSSVFKNTAAGRLPHLAGIDGAKVWEWCRPLLPADMQLAASVGENPLYVPIELDQQSLWELGQFQLFKQVKFLCWRYWRSVVWYIYTAKSFNFQLLLCLYLRGGALSLSLSWNQWWFSVLEMLSFRSSPLNCFKPVGCLLTVVWNLSSCWTNQYIWSCDYFTICHHEHR